MSDRTNTIKTARRAAALIVGGCLLLIGASLAVAQLPRAAILGVVKDSSGAVVPGASLGAWWGGPLKKDQLFLFGNYEDLRQRLGLTQLAFVPDANARQGMLPIGPNNTEILVPGLKPGILPFLNTFWPFPNSRAAEWRRLLPIRCRGFVTISG